MVSPRSNLVRRILSDGFEIRCHAAIGFGRLLFTRFRWYPLFSFDIHLSDSPSSDRIYTVGTDQIRSYNLFASDVIQDHLVSRNGRNSSFEMTPDFMIKLFNYWCRNLSDYIRMEEFHLSVFVMCDSIDPIGISYLRLSEIIRKFYNWLRLVVSVWLKR